jgi:putative ABC transport system permease protein
VLGRHRFFTFISLFGISFTLMILMVTTAFLETELGSHPPLT